MSEYGPHDALVLLPNGDRVRFEEVAFVKMTETKGEFRVAVGYKSGHISLIDCEDIDRAKLVRGNIGSQVSALAAEAWLAEQRDTSLKMYGNIIHSFPFKEALEEGLTKEQVQSLYVQMFKAHQARGGKA